jgi:hypothetical protein
MIPNKLICIVGVILSLFALVNANFKYACLQTNPSISLVRQFTYLFQHTIPRQLI